MILLFFKTLTNVSRMTWVFVVLGNSYDIKTGEYDANANALLSAQEFWFAVFMTVLYISPPSYPFSHD